MSSLLLHVSLSEVIDDVALGADFCMKPARLFLKLGLLVEFEIRLCSMARHVRNTVCSKIFYKIICTF